MDIVYNITMSRIRTCIECEEVLFIHARNMCAKCYFKKNNQSPKTKERKRIYQNKYYQKNKEKMLARSRAYAKTDKGKKVKQKYDKQHQDDLRFDGNREKVLKRDNYQCQGCGIKEKLVVHHIDRKSVRNCSTKANNKLSNLITLCNRCHMKKHGGKDRNPCKKFWDFVSKAVRMDIKELEELADKVEKAWDP